MTYSNQNQIGGTSVQKTRTKTWTILTPRDSTFKPQPQNARPKLPSSTIVASIPTAHCHFGNLSCFRLSSSGDRGTNGLPKAPGDFDERRWRVHNAHGRPADPGPI